MYIPIVEMVYSITLLCTSIHIHMCICMYLYSKVTYICTCNMGRGGLPICMDRHGGTVHPKASADMSGKSLLPTLHMLCNNTMVTWQHYDNNTAWITPQCIITITCQVINVSYSGLRAFDVRCESVTCIVCMYTFHCLIEKNA